MVSSVTVKHNPRQAKGGCHELSNWGGGVGSMRRYAKDNLTQGEIRLT